MAEFEPEPAVAIAVVVTVAVPRAQLNGYQTVSNSCREVEIPVESVVSNGGVRGDYWRSRR